MTRHGTSGPFIVFRLTAAGRCQHSFDETETDQTYDVELCGLRFDFARQYGRNEAARQW